MKDDAKAAKPKELWVLRGDKPVMIPVHTGLTDSTWIEITDSELAEGDLIITDASVPGEAPAAAHTSTSRSPRMF